MKLKMCPTQLRDKCNINYYKLNGCRMSFRFVCYLVFDCCLLVANTIVGVLHSNWWHIYSCSLLKLCSRISMDAAKQTERESEREEDKTGRKIICVCVCVWVLTDKTLTENEMRCAHVPKNKWNEQNVLEEQIICWISSSFMLYFLLLVNRCNMQFNWWY